MRVVNLIAAAATFAVANGFIPQQAKADTVCREECRGSVCRQVCIETEGRADRRDRREWREERRERREERRDRDPALELRVPGVELEIGR